MATSLHSIPFISLRTRKSFNLPTRILALRLSCCSGGPSQNQQVSSDSEKKRSFAVATGELFIGISSRLLKSADKRRSPSPPIDDDDRLATVVEDEIEPGIAMPWRVYHRRKKRTQAEEKTSEEDCEVQDVEAEKERTVITSPGFSFSAAGLLFPYHLGVAQLLIERGYIKDTTPLAGSSAGAIVCAVITSGTSTQEALQATKDLADDCRRNGTAFRLGALLREAMERLLPDDIHIRSNGRVRVAVTQVLWRPRGLLVDQFDSKSDLINAIFTSAFIPGYLAPRPATMFRNRVCVDGGLSFFMPPTAAAKTVRICAFSASNFKLKGIEISPDCNPLNRATSRQLLNWALEPAADEVLDMLFDLGYADAATWAERNPIDELVYDDTPAAQEIAGS